MLSKSQYCRLFVFAGLIFTLCMSLLALNIPNSIIPAQAENNGVAMTPPMGWNSWNHFHCGVTEAIVKAQAKAMVDSGLKAAGYQYVNIDDCWAKSRASDGTIQPDPATFPDGIKNVADYVHSLGLKFGIYTARGPLTCKLRPGSQGHETQDANTYAAWGVDYVKEDSCQTQSGDTQPAQTEFTKLSDAVKATGRPMVFSISNGSYGGYASWCLTIANMCRTEHDISANWDRMLGNFETNSAQASHAGSGYWNDPDMVEVGNGMTATEDQTHFALWAISAAPLILGNDMTSMSATTKAILTNSEVLTIDQDVDGHQGTKVATPATGIEVWARPLHGGNTAVVLLNTTASAANITVTWSNLGISGSQNVRDVIAQKNLGAFSSSYTANNVPSHGAVMIRISSASGPTITPTFVPPTITPGSYEAEAATLGGSAYVSACATCSGGQRVRSVGNNNGTVTFNVSVTASGSHKVTIFFLNGDATARTALLSVNGGTGTTVTYPSQGNWTTVGQVAVTVTLNAGSNTLKIYTTTAGVWSPDLDKITVQ